MRLFVDYHHADLQESLQIVFADRFGWDVFIPYGMAWFEEGVWAFEKKWHFDAVAKQYLLGIWGDLTPDANGVVTMADSRHPGRTLYGLTLEAARSMDFDAVISSVPDNAPGFKQFAEATGAKWGIHVGNQWGDEAWGIRPDFAIVTTTSVIPQGFPYVVVHQEFSLDVFYPTQPERFGPVRSFVNCFQETPEYPVFQAVARAAPEFEWEVYGAVGTGTADEFTKTDLHGIELVADKMRGSGVIWHAKHWSDGFGHVVHNAFAVGRPVFGYARYYEDKLAGPLWVDGVTSIDVERRTQDEVYNEIRKLRDDRGAYLDMCFRSARRFAEVVNFDDDAKQIEKMLSQVLTTVHV